MTWSQNESNGTLTLTVACNGFEKHEFTGPVDVQHGLTIKCCKVKLAEQVGPN